MALSALNAATAQAVLSSNTTRTRTASEEQATNQVAGTDTVEISEEGYALSAQASSETGTGSTASSSADSTEDTIVVLVKSLENDVSSFVTCCFIKTRHSVF